MNLKKIACKHFGTSEYMYKKDEEGNIDYRSRYLATKVTVWSVISHADKATPDQNSGVMSLRGVGWWYGCPSVWLCIVL